MRLRRRKTFSNQDHGREYYRGLIFLFFSALTVRLIYLVEISDVVAFDILLGDAAGYDRWARSISAGDWLGNDVFYQSPLYPYFLGIIYFLFGRDLLLVRIIQAVMGAVSCVLMAGAGTAFFNKRVGILGGWLLGLYPAAIYFDGSIQKTSLGLFLTTLLLWLLGLIRRRSPNWAWVACGMAVGCLGLIRENSLVLFVLVLPWIFTLSKEARWKKGFYRAGLFALGVGMILLPVGLRNKMVGGDFTLTTAQFGPNFYIGNNRTADGLYRELVWSRGNWRYERADAVRLAEEAAGRALGPAEVSNFWFRKTASEIVADPFSWVRLMVKKWGLLWNAAEIGDSESQYAYAHWSLLLYVLGQIFHFGLLCPLAAAGIWSTWADRRRLFVLYLVLFGYAGSVLLFYIFARYRAPMVPVLCLFAAAGMGRLFSLAREKEIKKIAAIAAVFLLVAVGVNREIIPSSYFAATTYNNLAMRLEDRDPEKAGAFYLEAVRLNPADGKVFFSLGCFLMKQQRFEEAVAAFGQVLKLDPKNAMAHDHIGRVYLKLDRPTAAEHHFRAAAEINNGLDQTMTAGPR